MKLKFKLLSCLAALLLVSVGSSVFARTATRRLHRRDARTTQNLWSQNTGSAAGSQSFVLYQNERGETVCREANAVERQQILGRTAAGETRVIYSGAPPRSEIGSGTFSPDSAPGLDLRASAGLRIVLHGTAQLDQNPIAKNAFIVAANRWEAIISTPITVVIDVDYGPNFFGQPYPSSSILGATGLADLAGSYSDLRQRLINGASTSVEQQLYSALPATAVPVEFNGVTSDVTSVTLALPNARALGMAPDISDPSSRAIGQGDAGVGFNSAFQFDFDPSDGISSSLADFDAVATHEIGHALGFVSEAGGAAASPVAVWDLFRFRPSLANLGNFATAPRFMSKGFDQIFFSNQLSTFATTELALSTGGPEPGPSDGDGRQSSHWKDDALLSTRPYIGIMDPTLARGLRRTISENDIRALDLFGYSIGAPAPVRPPNDNFVNALVLQTGSGSTTGSNANATREAGEPIHVGYMGDKSVWYSWVAPVTGQVTIDTAGSNFDTTLAVYLGPSVNQLGNLAQSDDVSSSDQTSRVQFNVTFGTTYRIVVDGWNGEYGNVNLNWSSSGSQPSPTPTPTPTPVPSPSPSPTPTPAADLAIESFVATPNPVATTQYVNFVVSGHNLGPGAATGTTVAIVLPAGTSFSVCSPSCNSFGLPSDGGTVPVPLGTVASGAAINVIVTAKVTATAGTVLSATASITSSSQDPNSNNNSSGATANVVDPVPFTEAKAISLSTEGAHVLLLRRSTVWAWGHNFYGQLGDGTTTNRNFPAQVDDLMLVKAISAGGHFSMALKEDGTVWTWGNNEHGELGSGSPSPAITTRPGRVPSLDSVVAIAAGTDHALALKSDGTVWAWGWNPTGALGIGAQDFAAHPTPNAVPGVSGIVKVFAGDGLSYAVKADGTVWGWGFGYGGQLGDGQTGVVTTTPVLLPALKGAIAVGSGAASTVVVKDDNTVWSFGYNGQGRLGRGLADASTFPVPTQIPFLTAKSVSSGYAHSVVIDLAGVPRTFGSNDTGQLGVGQPEVSYYSNPVIVSGINSVFATAAGGGATLVLTGDANSGGTVRAWGGNNFGVLGLGSTSPSYLPATVLEKLSVAKPAASVPAGSYSGSVVAFVACGTPASVIHYTTTGLDPTEADPTIASGGFVYTDHSVTLKARAWRSGFAPSTIMSVSYTVVPFANMIDNSANFVTQQYRDFLNREPDAGGLNFWANEITSCAGNQQCIDAKRVNVSAAFFLSIEFQGTGYLVERLYKAAYGDASGTSTFGGSHPIAVPIVRRTEFLPDTQTVAQGVIVGQGNWQQQLETNTQSFIADFVQRSRFTTAFPSSWTAAQFVDKLNTNAGSTLSQAERDQLVSDLTTNTKTRAQVLRAVAEDPDLNSAESNRAFVLMQFFGYLRRNPNDAPDSDYTGYDFWLTKLNQFNGNFVNADMVKAFINSSEYRQRFGP